MWRTIKVWILISASASALLQLFFFVQGLLPVQPQRIMLDGTALVVNFLFGFFISFLLIALDVAAIHFFNRRFPWKKYTVLRIISGAFSAVLLGMVIGTAVTVIYHAVSGSGNLSGNIAGNLIITPIANIIGFSVVEAFYIFKEWRRSLLLAERLEKENALARYEMLKQQLNPHFLFNSLSVLSGLVHTDAQSADEFIDRFADVYRHVLESVDRKTVPIVSELAALNSYIFLQKLRFGDGFMYDCHLVDDEYEGFLPPLSLQLLLENATKHNEASPERPLFVSVQRRKEGILVTNNKQPRVESTFSAGLGIRSLMLRYEMLSGQKPRIIESDHRFSVLLPVLNINADERSYH